MMPDTSPTVTEITLRSKLPLPASNRAPLSMGKAALHGYFPFYFLSFSLFRLDLLGEYVDIMLRNHCLKW